MSAIAWLRAEVESWPLLSPLAFERDLERLDLGEIRQGLGSSAALAAELEARVRTRARGLSLGAIGAVRDDAWFDGGRIRSVSPSEYVVALAKRRLSNGNVGPRLAGAESAASLASSSMRWRWLSLRVPADLLVAALGATDPSLPLTDCVDLSTPQLRTLLRDAPVASTHLHAKAALSFPLLWTSLMSIPECLDPPNLDEDAPFRGGLGLQVKLMACAFARVLAAFHLRGVRSGRWRSFGDGCSEFVRWATLRVGGRVSSDRLFECFRTALQCLGHSPTAITAVEHSACLGALDAIFTPLRGQAKSLSSLIDRDPLSAVLPGGLAAVPETHLLSECIRQTLSNPLDDGFARFFWRYARIRNAIFSHVTHEPGTSGLEWFQRHYDRLRHLRRGLNGHLLESSIRVEGRGINLTAIELRYDLPVSARELTKLVLGHVDCALKLDSRLESGLIFHFLKQRMIEGRAVAAPGANVGGARYSDWFISQRTRAENVAELLLECPEALTVIRGVDVAGDERAIPTWAVLPLIAIVRAAGMRAMGKLLARGIGVQALRTTVHAGEDYGSLQEGLRRVAEVMPFLRSGDRIGHGLALGEAPRDAMRRSTGVPSTVEDLSEDLMWELWMYQDGQLVPPSGRIERVRQILREILSPVYGEFSVDSHVLAMRMRSQWACLEHLGYPHVLGRDAPTSFRSEAEEVLWLYLTCPLVYAQMQRYVDERQVELGPVGEMQLVLRREVAARELTIESNPSSNLLILDSSDMSAHPAIGLTGGDGQSVVNVSVNSDDPLTFATSLPDEFARLFLAQMGSGSSSLESLHWVDRLRNTGWLSRFTLPESADPTRLGELHGVLLHRR